MVEDHNIYRYESGGGKGIIDSFETLNARIKAYFCMHQLFSLLD